MYKVAIVEDEWESADKLKQCLESYTKEYGVQFNIFHFKTGMEFLEAYIPDFDVVFMDIDMPHMNGLETAKALRKIDTSVELIFVTFLAKYAIKGYEFNALDYVLKPVNYQSFKIKIDRAIKKCSQKTNRDIALPTMDGIIRIDPNRVDYVEISGHSIVYHTVEGIFKAYGTMKDVENRLPSQTFFKCNRCYLVNLNSVTRIDGNVAYIGDAQLIISRPRRKDFLDALQELNM